MIGDRLVITDYHRQNGKIISKAAFERVQDIDRIFALTVAGESGSGKSETAATTAEELSRLGLKAAILGQDDYFRLPPRSNAKKRREDIRWVGMGEVQLDLMDQHLRQAKEGTPSIVKPLVFFEEDRIGEETINLKDVDVLIAEGTYTATLKHADLRIFIDGTYHSTLKHRKERALDEAEGEFIENVLEIEHQIIYKHKAGADIILPPPY